MSQNETLIGCLAKTGQNWHLKIESSKPYFILLSIFWQGHFKTSQPLIFFWCPLFKIESVGCPPAEKGGADTVSECLYNIEKVWTTKVQKFKFEDVTFKMFRINSTVLHLCIV